MGVMVPEGLPIVPGCAMVPGCAIESGRGDSLPSPRLGEFVREPKGELDGKGDPTMGDSVKRNMRGSICQNARRVTNIFLKPSASFSSVLVPTLESSVVIRPIRSSLASRCLPLNMPSRLMLMRHSPFGLPSSGIFSVVEFVIFLSGSGW